jgi:penicillin-binding protein 2
MSSVGPDRLRDRAGAARLVLAGAFLLLLSAFFRAQILGYEVYRLKAEQNRLRQVPLLAPRGAILDRNGEIIADNIPGYTVKLFAGREDSLRAVLSRMSAMVSLDSAATEAIVRRWRGARYQPALVSTGSTFESVSKLEEHRYLLPGLVVQTEPRRVYPSATAVAHLVGYVTEVTEGELASNRFPGSRLGGIVGRDGLERQYDSVLRGVDGVRYTEVDARGRLIREEVSSPSLSPIAGNPIHTSLDIHLQTYIDSLWRAELADTRGSMIAMTPGGEVLALYSAPSFDPNDFVGGIESQQWSALLNDVNKPLLNRATRGTYPPASPFKLATAVMALRKGIVGFATHMPEPCRGGYQFGNRYFRCWKKEGHGSLDLTGAISKSCDVYFYQLGLRLGLPTILEEGTHLGFALPTNIDLGVETKPFFPAGIQYYDRQYGPRGWSRAVTLNLSIGQGENNQSLISMMRFYGALAGDGKLRTPYIVKSRDTMPAAELGLSEADLAGLRFAMSDVVQRGTAAASGGRDLDVAGKTGTAQNPHGKDHGWFMAFAPATNPKIVVGSIMEFKEHGSTVAPYVVRVIRRYLTSQDSTLAKVPIRVRIERDSAPREQIIQLPDTARR